MLKGPWPVPEPGRAPGIRNVCQGSLAVHECPTPGARGKGKMQKVMLEIQLHPGWLRIMELWHGLGQKGL